MERPQIAPIPMTCLVTLNAPDHDSIEYICLNLRPADREEIYGILDHDNPFQLARQVLDAIRVGAGIVAGFDGKPVAFLGFIRRHPELCEAFAAGTSQFPLVAMSLTRYALKVMKPMLLAQGVKRIQCQSLMSHHTAHRWLQRLGFRREAILREYGRSGRDYIQYVVLASQLPTTNRSDGHLLSLSAQDSEAPGPAE